LHFVTLFVTLWSCIYQLCKLLHTTCYCVAKACVHPPNEHEMSLDPTHLLFIGLVGHLISVNWCLFVCMKEREKDREVYKSRSKKKEGCLHAVTRPVQIQTAVKDPVASQQCSVTQLLTLCTVHMHTHTLVRIQPSAFKPEVGQIKEERRKGKQGGKNRTRKMKGRRKQNKANKQKETHILSQI